MENPDWISHGTFRKKLPRKIIVLLSLLASAALFLSVSAQEGAELRLSLSRNFGFSSGTGKIQGTFTMKAAGPDDLVAVEFFIDEQLLGKVIQEPFRLRFHTENYAEGKHTLRADGYSEDGNKYRSNNVTLEFISAENGWRAGGNIVVIIFGIIIGVSILSIFFIIVLPSKQKDLPPGTPRKYGLSGGTICPRCHRPYGRHFLAPNVLVGKLDRCPFCSKWSVVRSVPLEILRAAEVAELEYQDGISHEKPLSEAERLQREIDDSRYQDF